MDSICVCHSSFAPNTFRFATSHSHTPLKKLVILISIDGFTPYYSSIHKVCPFLPRLYIHVQTPNLAHFIKNGTSAEYMLSSFPSATFPNHYAIATVGPQPPDLITRTNDRANIPKLTASYQTASKTLTGAPSTITLRKIILTSRGGREASRSG